LLAQRFLDGSQLAKWRADAIMEYERAQPSWDGILAQISSALPNLLSDDEIATIIEYMRNRASGPAFAASCARLI
jgi:hypothetical protein